MKLTITGMANVDIMARFECCPRIDEKILYKGKWFWVWKVTHDIKMDENLCSYSSTTIHVQPTVKHN